MSQTGESERLKLYRSALEGCERLLASGRVVSRVAFVAIIEQLKYLVDLETGACTDASRLTRLTIGVLTAREVDDVGFKDLAEVLYRVTADLRKRPDVAS